MTIAKMPRNFQPRLFMPSLLFCGWRRPIAVHMEALRNRLRSQVWQSTSVRHPNEINGAF